MTLVIAAPKNIIHTNFGLSVVVAVVVSSSYTAHMGQATPITRSIRMAA